MIKDMSERNKTENSRNKNSKEEKLFRAMSGVDEDLLLRSEQSGSGNTGKVHKFPTRYVSRIVAACLCFCGGRSIVCGDEQYENGRQYR